MRRKSMGKLFAITLLLIMVFTSLTAFANQDQLDVATLEIEGVEMGRSDSETGFGLDIQQAAGKDELVLAPGEEEDLGKDKGDENVVNVQNSSSSDKYEPCLDELNHSHNPYPEFIADPNEPDPCNGTCPDAKHKFDKKEVLNASLGAYGFITYTVSGSEYLSWTFTPSAEYPNAVITKVYVKGGPSENLYNYGSTGALNDAGLHPPVNTNNGKPAGISHIHFCVGEYENPQSNNPQIEITKTVSPETAKVGDTVTYSFTVTNTGNVDLTDVEITDPLFGAEWSIAVGTLAAGATSQVYTQTYTIESEKVNNNQLNNTATVTGTFDGSPVTDNDDAVVTISTDGGGGDQNTPGIEITKTVNPTTAKVGDTVTYSFTVTNTGNVDLTNVKITDPLFGEGWSIDIGDLAAGATSQVYTQTYTIKAGDVSNNQVNNTATVTGAFDQITVNDTDNATVTITTDSGGGSDEGGGGSDGDGGDSTPTPDEPLVVPEEPPVFNPPTEEQPGQPEQQEPIVVPEEPEVKNPQVDLPFTGGSEISFILSGLALTGFGVWMRRRSK